MSTNLQGLEQVFRCDHSVRFSMCKFSGSRTYGSNDINLRAGLYALFDIKLLFIASIIHFEVVSALCGAALSMNALVVGRVIVGVGRSGLFIGFMNS